MLGLAPCGYHFPEGWGRDYPMQLLLTARVSNSHHSPGLVWTAGPPVGHIQPETWAGSCPWHITVADPALAWPRVHGSSNSSPSQAMQWLQLWLGPGACGGSGPGHAGGVHKLAQALALNALVAPAVAWSMWQLWLQLQPRLYAGTRAQPKAVVRPVADKVGQAQSGQVLLLMMIMSPRAG